MENDKEKFKIIEKLNAIFKNNLSRNFKIFLTNYNYESIILLT